MIAAVVRYIRPDLAQEVGKADDAMPARGTDTHGNFHQFPLPERLFAPEALALYDRIRTVQAKVMMRGAKSETEIYA